MFLQQSLHRDDKTLSALFLSDEMHTHPHVRNVASANNNIFDGVIVARDYLFFFRVIGCLPVYTSSYTAARFYLAAHIEPA